MRTHNNPINNEPLVILLLSIVMFIGSLIVMIYNINIRFSMLLVILTTMVMIITLIHYLSRKK
jgi:hypothetical protein